MVLSLFKNSLGSLAIYHLSGRRMLPRREEDPTYVIPRKYSKVSDESSISNQLVLLEQFIVVEWEGPSDPDNPKNCLKLKNFLFLPQWVS